VVENYFRGFVFPGGHFLCARFHGRCRECHLV
jgi:hypothetical protein